MKFIFQVSGLFQIFDKFIQVRKKLKILKEEKQNTELFQFPNMRTTDIFQYNTKNYFIIVRFEETIKGISISKSVKRKRTLRLTYSRDVLFMYITYLSKSSTSTIARK